MSSKVLVICDEEDGYRSALAGYIIGRKELAVQVISCGTLSDLREIEKQTPIDYLFLSAHFAKEEREKIQAKKKFVLTRFPHEAAQEEETAIYKYQSGDSILSVLVGGIDENKEEAGLLIRPGGGGTNRIIGIFSPVHRVGKTQYALELGQKLSAKSNVLYLNMELYGGQGGTFPENPEQTLSDLLYYSRQESKNLNLFLAAVAQQMGSLDYIPPAAVSEDVRSVTKEEWITLVEQLVKGSFYDTLILDMDEGIQGIYDLLALCSEIHVLTFCHPTNQAKLRQFEQELHILGMEDVCRKLHRKEPMG